MGSLKEYVEKYERIYGKYEEILIPRPLYKLWDLEKFRSIILHIGSGTWKKFRALPPYRLWELEKFLNLISKGKGERSTAIKRWMRLLKLAIL